TAGGLSRGMLATHQGERLQRDQIAHPQGADAWQAERVDRLQAEVTQLRSALAAQKIRFDARVDELEARMNEIVFRLQLLGVCLIVMLSGILLWLIELSPRRNEAPKAALAPARPLVVTRGRGDAGGSSTATGNARSV